MKKTLLFSLLTFITLCFFPRPATAANMSNGSYTLEKKDAEIQPFTTQPAPQPKVEFQKPLMQGSNYTVETNKPDPFSFSLSSELIDFGKLTATNPVLRALNLNLTSHYGFQILGLEDHPLQKTPGTTIPDVTCDNGSCSEVTSAPWTNILTYGFGYSLDGDEYKHFANNTNNQGFTTITAGFKDNSSLKLTYKVNTSATQQAGSYNNTIIYLATPDY